MAEDWLHKFVLCQSCRGLFVNYQQCVSHVGRCDGDAFKSPAQLFACERKFVLEALRRTDTFLSGVGVFDHQEQPSYEVNNKHERVSDPGHVSDGVANSIANLVSDIPCDISQTDCAAETRGTGSDNGRQTPSQTAETSDSSCDSVLSGILSQQDSLSESFADKLQSGLHDIHHLLENDQVLPESESVAAACPPQAESETSLESESISHTTGEILGQDSNSSNKMAFSSAHIIEAEVEHSTISSTSSASKSGQSSNVCTTPATALLAYLHKLQQRKSGTIGSTESAKVHDQNSESGQVLAGARESDHSRSGPDASPSIVDHGLCSGRVCMQDDYVHGSSDCHHNLHRSDLDCASVSNSSSLNQTSLSHNAVKLRNSLETNAVEINENGENTQENSVSSGKGYQQDLLGVALRQTLLDENVINITETHSIISSVNDASSFSIGDDSEALIDQEQPVQSLTAQKSIQNQNKKKTKTMTAAEKKAKLESMRFEVLQQCSEIPADSSSKKSKFCCQLCGHSTASVAFMHKHLQSHNGGNKFRCDYCSFTCVRRSRMAEHQARHSRPKLLCQHCSATFSDTSSLNRHIASKHTENPALKCDECDFMASDPSSLLEHTRKHTGKMLHCEVEGCDFKTAYQRALRLHQKRHAADKKFSCHLCHFRCIEASVLTRHLHTHQSTKPFKCSSCAFTGNTRHEVVRHMRSKHEQQKRYACDKCSFRTPYPNSITKHIIAHMGPSAAIFACPLCKLRSNSLGRAKKHLHKVHEREDLDVLVLQEPIKVNPADYICRGEPVDVSMVESRTIDEVMAGRCASVESGSLSSSPPGGLESGRIDPMKLSFHFHDIPPPPGNSGVHITRSSSIPDLFTFSGMNAGNRSNSQSDLLTFSGINITRSNSMSDLVSFASSMCAESSEPVNMDVSLSDATTPSVDVHGLSLGDGTEVSLSDGVQPGSPGVVVAAQCSNCLALLMNEEDVDTHNKSCTGLVQMV
ncbi:hypothetical protein BaRGS_00029049 [Batillaria attramentaria]|uniref:C2H2-type domain-containing protein n=1 Tax=Batillaria attramentaria TaxID=370345 RepID=A0ABD0JXH7_9CAEN